MNEDNEVKMSPLCQAVTREGKTIQIEIYEDGEGGWVLEVVDEDDNSTLWDDSFDTDVNALSEALATIEKEGIDSLIGPDTRVLH
jgi:hypothetical protein